MAYRAVLFDLDGTLLDTLADLGGSMNEVLASLGFPAHPLADYKRYVGDGVANLARRALPAANRDDATVERCVAEMRRIYGSRWDRKTRPYPGIEDLLARLSDAGIAMAVLSNKPDDLTRVIVASLLGRWRFDAVVGAKPEVARKPDPAAALGIADALAVEPREVVYVGDTDTDMKTATAAGMYAVGALWGFRGADELRDNGALALVGTPGEILSLL